MSDFCEHCGEPSVDRYCDDDCRRADKTGTGPKACAAVAGYEGHCGWHDRPVTECEAELDDDPEGAAQ